MDNGNNSNIVIAGKDLTNKLLEDILYDKNNNRISLSDTDDSKKLKEILTPHLKDTNNNIVRAICIINKINFQDIQDKNGADLKTIFEFDLINIILPSIKDYIELSYTSEKINYNSQKDYTAPLKCIFSRSYTEIFNNHLSLNYEHIKLTGGLFNILIKNFLENNLDTYGISKTFAMNLFLSLEIKNGLSSWDLKAITYRYYTYSNNFNEVEKYLIKAKICLNSENKTLSKNEKIIENNEKSLRQLIDSFESSKEKKTILKMLVKNNQKIFKELSEEISNITPQKISNITPQNDIIEQFFDHLFKKEDFKDNTKVINLFELFFSDLDKNYISPLITDIYNVNFEVPSIFFGLTRMNSDTIQNLSEKEINEEDILKKSIIREFKNRLYYQMTKYAIESLYNFSSKCFKLTVYKEFNEIVNIIENELANQVNCNRRIIKIQDFFNYINNNEINNLNNLFNSLIKKTNLSKKQLTDRIYNYMLVKRSYLKNNLIENILKKDIADIAISIINEENINNLNAANLELVLNTLKINARNMVLLNDNTLNIDIDTLIQMVYLYNILSIKSQNKLFINLSDECNNFKEALANNIVNTRDENLDFITKYSPRYDPELKNAWDRQFQDLNEIFYNKIRNNGIKRLKIKEQFSDYCRAVKNEIWHFENMFKVKENNFYYFESIRDPNSLLSRILAEFKALKSPYNFLINSTLLADIDTIFHNYKQLIEQNNSEIDYYLMVCILKHAFYREDSSRILKLYKNYIVKYGTSNTYDIFNTAYFNANKNLSTYILINRITVKYFSKNKPENYKKIISDNFSCFLKKTFNDKLSVEEFIAKNYMMIDSLPLMNDILKAASTYPKELAKKINDILPLFYIGKDTFNSKFKDNKRNEFFKNISIDSVSDFCYYLSKSSSNISSFKKIINYFTNIKFLNEDFILEIFYNLLEKHNEKDNILTLATIFDAFTYYQKHSDKMFNIFIPNIYFQTMEIYNVLKDKNILNYLPNDIENIIDKINTNIENKNIDYVLLTDKNYILNDIKKLHSIFISHEDEIKNKLKSTYTEGEIEVFLNKIKDLGERIKLNDCFSVFAKNYNKLGHKKLDDFSQDIQIIFDNSYQIKNKDILKFSLSTFTCLKNDCRIYSKFNNSKSKIVNYFLFLNIFNNRPNNNIFLNNYITNIYGKVYNEIANDKALMQELMNDYFHVKFYNKNSLDGLSCNGIGYYLDNFIDKKNKDTDFYNFSVSKSIHEAFSDKNYFYNEIIKKIYDETASNHYCCVALNLDINITGGHVITLIIDKSCPFEEIKASPKDHLIFIDSSKAILSMLDAYKIKPDGIWNQNSFQNGGTCWLNTISAISSIMKDYDTFQEIYSDLELVKEMYFKSDKIIDKIIDYSNKNFLKFLVNKEESKLYEEKYINISDDSSHQVSVSVNINKKLFAQLPDMIYDYYNKSYNFKEICNRFKELNGNQKEVIEDKETGFVFTITSDKTQDSAEFIM